MRMTWRASPMTPRCRFQPPGSARPQASGCPMSSQRFALRAPLARVLVVDAAVVITACLSEAALSALGREELVAPHLMWSEASSVLHELRRRKEISAGLANIALAQLSVAAVRPRQPKGLIEGAWRIADSLG